MWRRPPAWRRIELQVTGDGAFSTRPSAIWGRSLRHDGVRARLIRLARVESGPAASSGGAMSGWVLFENGGDGLDHTSRSRSCSRSASAWEWDVPQAGGGTSPRAAGGPHRMLRFGVWLSMRISPYMRFTGTIGDDPRTATPPLLPFLVSHVSMNRWRCWGRLCIASPPSLLRRTYRGASDRRWRRLRQLTLVA